MDQLNVTVATKQDKDSDAKETILTIDFEGCPSSTIRALAVQALIVKLQGAWRKGSIPGKVAVNMKDYAPGTRHAAASMTPEQALATVKAEALGDKAKRAALIAELQAMQ